MVTALRLMAVLHLATAAATSLCGQLAVSHGCLLMAFLCRQSAGEVECDRDD